MSATNFSITHTCGHTESYPIDFTGVETEVKAVRLQRLRDCECASCALQPYMVSGFGGAIYRCTDADYATEGFGWLRHHEGNGGDLTILTSPIKVGEHHGLIVRDKTGDNYYHIVPHGVTRDITHLTPKQAVAMGFKMREQGFKTVML
ncbi:MAG: hypothetical protein PHP00_06755 [Thiotrichaceae bacterium]|nr:hypothetical protein [Thiotrichaceae bacterium]